MTFELPLAGEKVKRHHVIALHLLSALVFIGAGAIFYLLYPPAHIWSIALIAIGGLLLIVTLFRNRLIIDRNLQVRSVELVILISLAALSAWLRWTPPTIMFTILSAAIAFALFWEKGSNMLVVKLDNEGVRLPVSARKRFIPWPEVDQVLFKYGTLTINCCDNRLFQWPIQNTAIDQSNFEAFCMHQIEEGKTKRDKNDW